VCIGARHRQQLSKVRKALKSSIASDLQARKLAKEALVSLHPQAAATEQRLLETSRLIPAAQQLRGESEAARNAALDLLEEAESQSTEKDR